MSQGQFGNLCDTDNFGDPVVLYDSFEDRWFITDFAFKLDASGNVNPQHVFECFAVSMTGDPVNGGWNFYSIETPGGLGDYPKFGIWPDGIYMSANMFGYSSSSSYTGFHVWALNKQQMYDGEPSVQVVDFSGDSSDFSLLPANARLQTGTPAAGAPEYFVSTEQFLNALSIYKFHVDWDKVSTSTFTGPLTQLQPNCWPNATSGQRVDACQLGRYARDPRDGAGAVLEPRRRRVALGDTHRPAQRQRHEHELQRRDRRQRQRPLVPGERDRRHRRRQCHPGRDLRS